MTNNPTRLHEDIYSLRARPPARPRFGAPSRPQVRRYTTTTLLPDGDICETRHLAPALPLFEDAFCAFARGSLVETETGPVAIEDLLPGDRLITLDGDVLPVVWKGNVTVVPGQRNAQRRNMLLTRLMADSFGMARPTSCMIAGPSARLLHSPEQHRGLTGGARMLTPVHTFIDGVNVIETAPPTPVELYHLCLPQHAVIRVGGLEFETYHPGENALRMTGHAIRSLFLELFAHVDSAGGFGPLAHPRAGDGQISAISA